MSEGSRDLPEDGVIDNPMPVKDEDNDDELFDNPEDCPECGDPNCLGECDEYDDVEDEDEDDGPEFGDEDPEFDETKVDDADDDEDEEEQEDDDGDDEEEEEEKDDET